MAKKPPKGNVFRFTGATVLSYPPGQFLRQLADHADESDDFETVLVIAMRKSSGPSIHVSTMNDERNLALAHVASAYLTSRYAAEISKGFSTDPDEPAPKTA